MGIGAVSAYYNTADFITIGKSEISGSVKCDCLTVIVCEVEGNIIVKSGGCTYGDFACEGLLGECYIYGVGGELVAVAEVDFEVYREGADLGRAELYFHLYAGIGGREHYGQLGAVNLAALNAVDVGGYGVGSVLLCLKTEVLEGDLGDCGFILHAVGGNGARCKHYIMLYGHKAEAVDVVYIYSGYNGESEVVFAGLVEGDAYGAELRCEGMLCVDILAAPFAEGDACGGILKAFACGGCEQLNCAFGPVGSICTGVELKCLTCLCFQLGRDEHVVGGAVAVKRIVVGGLAGGRL